MLDLFAIRARNCFSSKLDLYSSGVNPIHITRYTRARNERNPISFGIIPFINYNVTQINAAACVHRLKIERTERNRRAQPVVRGETGEEIMRLKKKLVTVKRRYTPIFNINMYTGSC